MTQNKDLIHLFNTSLLAAVGTLIMLWSFDIPLIMSMIYAHAGLGFLSFGVGAITLLSKKGSPLHVYSGRVFYYTMVVSVTISLVVALLPGHLSPTMFHIAVLSLYFLLGGKRSILFKFPNHNLTVDKLLAYWVITTSVAVMAYTFFVEGRIHPLRTVFGTIGVVFGSLDIWLFRANNNIRRQWLFLHLSKMMGGYIAAVTAFFVAQQILSGYYNWFTPTVIGLSAIAYWAVKLKTFKPIKQIA